MDLKHIFFSFTGSKGLKPKKKVMPKVRCPKGTKRKGNSCVPDCPKGYALKNGSCQKSCPKGAKAFGKKCIKSKD
jgi:hypothetical protein